MSIYKRYKIIRALFVVSLVLSLLSILSVMFNYGEIYPFFFWKLYSQPLGTQNKCTEYRIYCKDGSNNYQRKSIVRKPTFNIEEYAYTFNSLVDAYIVTESDLNLKKLQCFIKEVEPDCKDYKIVAESYNPKSILSDSLKYDTSSVLTFRGK